MVLKRSYQVDSKYTRPYKRTKTSLSVALAIRKPELKEVFFRQNGGIAINTMALTSLAIPQGTASNQRIGDHVRIMSVHVQGLPTGQGSTITASVVCPKNASTPAIGDFTAGAGNFYDMNKGWALAYWNTGVQGTNACMAKDFSYTFKMGMVQEYDGANFLRNGLFFCSPNSTGTAVTQQDCVIRVRYYDV
jgi:hypothetical protein